MNIEVPFRGHNQRITVGEEESDHLNRGYENGIRFHNVARANVTLYLVIADQLVQKRCAQDGLGIKKKETLIRDEHVHPFGYVLQIIGI